MTDASPADHRAVELVLLRYCRLVDENRATPVADLFTADAVFDYGLGRVFRGRDQLLRLFREGLARHEATSHHLSNVVVDLDSDGRHARAGSTVYAWHRRRDGVEVQLWGRYEDRLERSSETRTWMFTARSLRVAGARHDPSSPPPEPEYERFPRQDS